MDDKEVLDDLQSRSAKLAKSAKDDAKEALDLTMDAVEEAVETLERIPKVHLNGTTKKQQYLILGVTAAVAAIVTGVIVHRITRKRLAKKYDEIAKKEILEAKEFYGRLHKTSDEVMTPEQTLENIHGKEAVQAMKRYQTGIPAEAPVATEDELSSRKKKGKKKVSIEELKRVPMQNTVVVDDDWDYEVELTIRAENPNKPYIIHQDEFLEGEKDFNQSNLTYYEGDDVLADDDLYGIEGVYQNVNEVVGEDNLTQFGHGSNDPNVVYIRNDALGIDYEVARSTGKYAKEVLGFDDEDVESVQHSNRREGRKSRGHDD